MHSHLTDMSNHLIVGDDTLRPTNDLNKKSPHDAHVIIEVIDYTLQGYSYDYL
jgi:hypothetical protein